MQKGSNIDFTKDHSAVRQTGWYHESVTVADPRLGEFIPEVDTGASVHFFPSRPNGVTFGSALLSLNSVYGGFFILNSIPRDFLSGGRNTTRVFLQRMRLVIRIDAGAQVFSMSEMRFCLLRNRTGRFWPNSGAVANEYTLLKTSADPFYDQRSPWNVMCQLGAPIAEQYNTSVDVLIDKTLVTTTANEHRVYWLVWDIDCHGDTLDFGSTGYLPRLNRYELHVMGRNGLTDQDARFGYASYLYFTETPAQLTENWPLKERLLHRAQNNYGMISAPGFGVLPSQSSATSTSYPTSTSTVASSGGGAGLELVAYDGTRMSPAVQEEGQALFDRIYAGIAGFVGESSALRNSLVAIVSTTMFARYGAWAFPMMMPQIRFFLERFIGEVDAQPNNLVPELRQFANSLAALIARLRLVAGANELAV